MEAQTSGMHEQLDKLKPYILVVLSKGENYENEDTPEIIRTQHLPYVFKQKQAGVLSIAMPVRDQTDIAAIGIYNLTDKEQLKGWLDKDPAVIQGVFTYEILNSIGMQGDQLL